MNLHDLEKILIRIRNQPVRMLFIILILVLIISAGTILTSFLKEQGKQLASINTQLGVKFSRITLDTNNKYWKKVPRNTPNRIESEFMSDSIAYTPKRTCPGNFLSEDWCKKSELFFSQIGLQEEAIDPSFDIVIENQSKKSVILLFVGVEIVNAFYSPYSFGYWDSTKIVIEGEYKVQMPPPPITVRLKDGSIIDIEKKRLDMSYQGVSIEGMLGPTDWEWVGLPILAEEEIIEPIYMQPNTPYRFLMVLKEYKNMPNNVVLRFWVKTNDGVHKSSYVYLLAI